MGTASAGWSFGAGRGWGHYGAVILTASIVAMVLLAVQPPPPDSPAAVVLPLGLLVVVIGSWLLMRRHDRRLCELCLRHMPLDAAARAQRYQRRFAVVHAGADRRITGSYLLVLLGSNALLFVDGPAPRLVWAAVQLSLVYLVLAYSAHRALQPWCPWCAGGGGGGGLDRVDTPGPLPVGGHRS